MFVLPPYNPETYWEQLFRCLYESGVLEVGLMVALALSALTAYFIVRRDDR